MKKATLAILSFCLMIATVSVQANAYTMSDFDLQTKLENFFTARMKARNPDLHFAITVRIHEMPEYRMESIRKGEPESQLSYGVDKRIEFVTVMSENDQSLNELAETLSIPADKIHFLKLQKKTSPVSAKPTLEQTLEKTLDKYAVEVGHVLKNLQNGIFIFLFAVFALGTFSILNAAPRKPKNSPARKPKTRAKSKNKKDTETFPFSDAQLKAIFAECYWTEHDEEACGLILKYPRMEVYKQLRFGEEYIQYLKKIAPTQTDFLADRYYLDPIESFQEISVPDTPNTILSFASQFRFEAKNVDTNVLLSQYDKSKLFEFITQAPHKSVLRTLSFPVKVIFRTIDEEDSVLQNPEYSDALKMNLPSLYRLFRLDKPNFFEILSHFTPEQLAEAWVGPQWLTDALELKMEAAQRKALQKAKKKITPSRNSATFKKIISQASQETVLFSSEKVEMRLAA